MFKMQQHITCLFCEEAFDRKNEVVLTKCGHVFHCKCLNKWLKTSSACPLCTRKVLKKENIKLHLKFSNSRSSVDNRIADLNVQVRKKKAESHKKSLEIKKLEKTVAEYKSNEFSAFLKLKGVEDHSSLIKSSTSFIDYYEDKNKELCQEITKLKQEIRRLKNVDDAEIPGIDLA